MMQLVPMCEAHVTAIAELEKLCFSDPWSENSIRYELTNPLSYWIVAMENDRVAGYVGSQAVLDEADMMNIAVHPDFRRRGVALSLIEALVSELKERNVHCLTLEVRASNDPAISLYQKLGFLQVGRRPNYYRNPKEDAWILRKDF